LVNISCILGDPAGPNVDISYPEPSEDRYEFQENNETQQRISNNVRIPRRGPHWFVNRKTPNTLDCVMRMTADPELQRTLQQQTIASNYSADSEIQERNYQIGRHTFTYIHHTT
jgi:hypothetical protein